MNATRSGCFAADIVVDSKGVTPESVRRINTRIQAFSPQIQCHSSPIRIRKRDLLITRKVAEY